MGYREDFNVTDALHSAYEIGKLLSDYVFTGDRPQAVPENMKDFVVVSIPTRMESLTYGGGYGLTSGYCNFEIYVRHKKGGVEDLKRINQLIGELLDTLPYSDANIQLARPTIVLRGSDGLGFSAVLVRAELVIK